MTRLDPAELAMLQAHYRRVADHLADVHDVHRGGSAGQLAAWHAHVHWLACTPTHDLWPATGPKAPQ
jgi:hypothetical protein